MTTSATAPDPLDDVFDSAWLTEQDFPPVEYVVPGVIPEGLTILVAPPKVGKSWMVLGIAEAAASGGQVFGAIQVKRRPVLYLALEDGPRRLKSRLKVIGVESGNNNLMFLTKLMAGVDVTMQAFLERHGHNKPLIILDTLGKVRGTYSGNDAYGKDYSQMSALKGLVDDVPGSSLIVVHHTNKGEKSDFLDSVSGTQGLAGAADSILAIRRERNTTNSTLHVTSRDAAEGEYALTLTDGVWAMDGATLQDAADAVLTRESTAGVADPMAELVKMVTKYPEGTKADGLAVVLGWEKSKVATYLARAEKAGRVVRLEWGKYGPVTTPHTPLLNV
ncbi:AAA family ATPase [Glutamicibacter ardleyensis]|uniref:AAA family ATPase n=1 Tax=Glutamicibacter ardleyensis TaxID=225894 RepID=UPI003FD1650C